MVAAWIKRRRRVAAAENLSQSTVDAAAAEAKAKLEAEEEAAAEAKAKAAAEAKAKAAAEAKAKAAAEAKAKAAAEAKTSKPKPKRAPRKAKKQED